MIQRSLGLQIAIAFLLVGLLPFGGLAVLSRQQVRVSTQNMLRESMSLLTKEIGVEIERTVFSAYTHIQSLAQHPIIVSPTATLEEKLAEMRKIQQFYGIFEDITLVNPDGVVLGSMSYQYRGEWKTKQWFQQAKEGKATVSPVHVVPSPFKLVFVVTAPVFSPDGKLQAVIGGQVNMQSIWEITDHVHVGQTGRVVLLDKSGNIIAGPDKDLLLEKFDPPSLIESMAAHDSGLIEFALGAKTFLASFEHLKGYNEYPGQEWTIALIRDHDDAFAVLERMRMEILLTAAAGCFFVVLLSMLFSRTILLPITGINVGLERIASGDLAARVPVKTRDELGRLSQAFNTMAEEIYRKTIEVDAANQQLNAVNSKLSESNTNLQQFAYVASHDLQEPLRMVSSYMQLISRRYKGKLDAEADEFIGFAVDGAHRMQQLINDLLEYSRVGTRAKPLESTDVEAVLARVLQTLKLSIEERGAIVTHDPMPTIMADPVQIGQLLQNLIGNALKFCKDRPPHIHVGAVKEGADWKLWVKDNGIGIDAKYYDRIFTIFQRLHTREEYAGTGIGLAICKKIVQRHGGRIWVESKEGEGSMFLFTLSEQGGMNG